MRESDLPAIDKLYAELHEGVYGDLAPAPARMRRAFQQIAASRDHHLLVAEFGGQVLGTLHIFIFRHLGHGLRPAAIVENVVVSSTMRSLGIGEAMLAAAHAIAKREQCYKLSLTSNVKRPRAHRFYERIGWRRTHFGYSLSL